MKKVVLILAGLIVALIGGLIGNGVMDYMRSARADQLEHTTYYGVTGSDMLIHNSGKPFKGTIITPRVKINEICVVQVKPDAAVNDNQSFPALMACDLNPTKGDKVQVVDYIISMPHHLSDMVHIAEKIVP